MPRGQSRQVPWRKLAQGIPGYRSRTDNRIYYARTREEAQRWITALSPPDTWAVERVNFRRYGVIAVFLTPRPNVRVDGVFSVSANGLDVHVRTVWPVCEPPPSCVPGCVIVDPPCPFAVGTYVLIAVRKGALPRRVHELYISEKNETP